MSSSSHSTTPNDHTSLSSEYSGGSLSASGAAHRTGVTGWRIASKFGDVEHVSRSPSLVWMDAVLVVSS
eukprot:1419570-Rhodomonas_salina.1